MPDPLVCYRCGESLEKLSLPISRQDLCPGCSAAVHVCRMCCHFDPGVPDQCREDDAEAVTDKEQANYCEWFVPMADAYDPGRANQAARARAALDSLFSGEQDGASDDDSPASAAEDLFR